MSPVIAITGAPTPVVVATARRFAARGDAVALLAATAAEVASAGAAVGDHDGRVLGVVVDPTDPDAVEGAADRVERALGPVDVWVTAAEDPEGIAFGDLCPAHLRDVTGRVYLASVHATMTAVERMSERGGGTVVHVTTPLGRRGRPGHAAASGARAALRGFHEAVTDELRADGSSVRVVVVERRDGAGADEVAREVVRAAGSSTPQRHDRRRRVGALGTGAAVGAGTAAFLRRRRRRR